MNNNLNISELEISCLFFRCGKSYYYTYKGETYEINKISINKLKEKLTVPFKFRFLALSRAQIEKIVYSFLDKDTDVVYDKIIKHSVLMLEATFIHEKRYVDVYKVSDIGSLFDSANKWYNPFLYKTIDDSSKILIEVTKDYAKNNEGDYYFLSSDLDEVEREFFDSQYVKLECDYVYRIERDINAKKGKTKKNNKLNKIQVVL